MEKGNRGNKRNRNRKANEANTNPEEKVENIEEDSDKNILKKYFDRDIEELNQAELKKIKVYIDEIRDLMSSHKKNNFEALVKSAESNVKNIKY